MVEVGSFRSRAHAEMAAGMLHARGVDARVLADDAGGVVPHVTLGMHGYRLGVPDHQGAEAQRLLAEHADVDDPPSATHRRAPAWVTAGRLVLAVLVVAMLVGILVTGIGDIVRAS